MFSVMYTGMNFFPLCTARVWPTISGTTGHRHAPHMRPPAEPAAASRLADRHVLVIEVADLPDRGEALDVNLPDLARRHLHRRVLAFLRDDLHTRPGAARDLSAFARLELHV